jgi:hypothetical protein
MAEIEQMKFTSPLILLPCTGSALDDSPFYTPLPPGLMFGLEGILVIMSLHLVYLCLKKK